MLINFKEYCKKEFAKLPHNSGKKIAIIEDKCPSDSKYFKQGVIKHCEELGVGYEVINVNDEYFKHFINESYKNYNGAIVIERLGYKNHLKIMKVFCKCTSSLSDNYDYDLDNYLKLDSNNVVNATLKAIELTEIDLKGKSITVVGSGLGFEFMHSINNSKNRPGMIINVNSTFNKADANMLYQDSRYIFNFGKGEMFTPYNITHHTVLFDVGYGATKELKKFYKETESVKIVNVAELNYLELFKKLFN